MVEELSLDPAGMARLLADGDVVNVFTLSPRLINAVTLRGNVATPLRFEWKEDLHVSDLIPERSMLVVPDYWLQRNRAGRPQSWIAESTEAKGDGAVKVTRDVKRPGAEVNWDYAVVERLNPLDYSTILIPFNLGSAIADKASEHNLKLEPGDIVTIFSKEDIQGPQSKQSKFVRLEGEFQTAGVYQIEPGETLRRLMARVGGITSNAYVYGAEFTRDSTREQQQKQLDEALGRLEVEMQRSGVKRAQGVIEPEQAQSLQAEAQAQKALLAKLKQIRATGTHRARGQAGGEIAEGFSRSRSRRWRSALRAVPSLDCQRIRFGLQPERLHLSARQAGFRLPCTGRRSHEGCR